jgi:hypothetical protein
MDARLALVPPQAGGAPPGVEMRGRMCRSIKTLRKPELRATDEEINAAALQYVRKVSGYRKPSRPNQAAFQAAVQEVAAATRKMLETLNAGV